jgi:hypothetical protein
MTATAAPYTRVGRVNFTARASFIQVGSRLKQAGNQLVDSDHRPSDLTLPRPEGRASRRTTRGHRQLPGYAVYEHRPRPLVSISSVFSHPTRAAGADVAL